MNIYIIHNGSTRRRERLEKMFERMDNISDIIWMTYPNAKDLTSDLKSSLISENTYLSDGRISCTYKHYLAMKDIVSKELPYALIMEDNVGDIYGDIYSNFQRYMRELDGHKWDVIFDTYFDLIYTEDIIRNDKVVYKKDNHIGDGSTKTATFYFLTLDCAKKLVNNFIPFHMVIDHYLNYLFKKLDIQSYWILPSRTTLEDNHISSV